MNVANEELWCSQLSGQARRAFLVKGIGYLSTSNQHNQFRKYIIKEILFLPRIKKTKARKLFFRIIIPYPWYKIQKSQ